LSSALNDTKRDSFCHYSAIINFNTRSPIWY